MGSGSLLSTLMRTESSEQAAKRPPTPGTKGPLMAPRRPAVLTARIPHSLLAEALRQGLKHQVRVWLLIRAVEPEGPGHIRRDTAVEVLRSLGLSRTTAYAWIDSLVKSVFASVNRTKYGDEVIVFSSYEKLSEALGIDLNGRYLRFSAAPLLERRYLRSLSMACSCIHDGRPIARSTKVRLYGPSASTQRRAEHDAGARVTSNYRRYRRQV
jgi:hypothetical protein